MQPYFLPYAGYFRLMAMADVFVVFDDVQFPRRGYVHRNRFRDRTGNGEWFTLPLRKKPRDSLICDQEFHESAQSLMEGQFSKFPIFDSHDELSDKIVAIGENTTVAVADILVELMLEVCKMLDLDCEVVSSKRYRVPKEMTGQDRIIELVKRVNGDSYINSPGGMDIYSHDKFNDEGLRLEFLTHYQGSGLSIAQDIADWGIARTKDQIYSQLTTTR